MIPKPNFFIIGAPRCGTTALSEYLKSHPRIGFSIPKEPHFFASDLPNLRCVEHESDYLKTCFGHLEGGEYAAVGEASVWYLYSKEAIEQILAFDPNAKFIVMIRNPRDMVQALYEKYIESLQENCSSFEKAWHLQSQRKLGKQIPKHCKHASMLMYADVARMGEQLERAMKLIPANQLKLIVFDDFISHTGDVYSSVLDFLNIPDDGRSVFPRINEGQQVNLRWLYQEISIPNPWLMKIVSFVKRLLHIERLDIQPRLRQLFVAKRDKKAVLSAQLQDEMRQEFSNDILLLEKLLQRDLSHWMGGPR